MQIIIVSGGSSGIGKACVDKFLHQGQFVYNFDIVERESPVQHNLTNYTWIKVDVTHPEAIKHAVNSVIAAHSKIDVVIVSAGKHLSANIEKTSHTQLIELINLNILGTFWLIQTIIPHMKIQLKGNIITIGSDQSTIAKKNSAVYGMTKAAITHLTKSTALDYAKYNIRANCIGAGTIDTPLYRKAITRYSQKSGISLTQIEQEEAEEQPIGRIGKAEEVAELAYFLAQDNAAFITGALIPIDGGYIAK